MCELDDGGDEVDSPMIDEVPVVRRRGQTTKLDLAEQDRDLKIFETQARSPERASNPLRQLVVGNHTILDRQGAPRGGGQLLGGILELGRPYPTVQVHDASLYLDSQRVAVDALEAWVLVNAAQNVHADDDVRCGTTGRVEQDVAQLAERSIPAGDFGVPRYFDAVDRAASGPFLTAGSRSSLAANSQPARLR